MNAMSTTTAERSWRMVDFQYVPGVPCPCGTARHAFADVAEYPGTIHLVPVTAGMCAMIPPGVRQRVLGEMTILNIVFPKFDSVDEFKE
jgi:hypothetical protein